MATITLDVSFRQGCGRCRERRGPGRAPATRRAFGCGAGNRRDRQQPADFAGSQRRHALLRATVRGSGDGHAFGLWQGKRNGQ